MAACAAYCSTPCNPRQQLFSQQFPLTWSTRAAQPAARRKHRGMPRKTAPGGKRPRESADQAGFEHGRRPLPPTGQALTAGPGPVPVGGSGPAGSPPRALPAGGRLRCLVDRHGDHPVLRGEGVQRAPPPSGTRCACASTGTSAASPRQRPAEHRPRELGGNHGVQPFLPLVLVDDFEVHDPAAHGRNELRPVPLGGVLGADVEDTPFVDRVGGFLQV